MESKLLEATVNIVRSRGEQLFIDVSRPYAYTLVAKFDKRKYIIRIAFDADQVSQSSLKDLKLLSMYTDATSICVVSTVKSQVLQRGVVHIKDSVVFMSLATFTDVLEGKKPIYKLSRGIIAASIDGEKLRERRQKMGMSLSALAHKLGVTRETVYRYERGEIEPPLRIAEKLASIFGNDIIKEIEVNEKPKATLEELASRQISPNMYRLVESHPDAIRHNGRTIFVISDLERFRKTVELAQALGAEVDKV
jgi:putative transcriptional regulator